MDFELACFQIFVGSARKWGRGCNHTYMSNTITKKCWWIPQWSWSHGKNTSSKHIATQGLLPFQKQILVHESFENNLADTLLGNTLTYKIKNKEYDNNGLILVHHKKENC